MERLERIEHPQEALMTAFQGWQAGMWTTLPGIIQSFDATEMTVSVQPSLQAKVTSQETGAVTWTNLPLLVDVPVVIQSSGGMSVTMPIAKGDECLVSFSSRCIDAWWQSGGIQPQSELRMHDLSDGFAFIGPRSLTRIIQNYSTSTMQIRSDDGGVVIDIDPVSHNVVGTMTKLTINSELVINGKTTHNGQVWMNSKRVDETHAHSDPQGGNTGAVV